MAFLRRHFHTVFFNGVDLADFGVHVSGNGVFNAPERDYETIEIPGRNGDLLIDKGRYKNVDITYHAFIANDFRRNIDALRDFLLGSRGYNRLEDTYHPEEYRNAVFKGPLEIDTIMLKAGEFDLTFNCKPQRFMKAGEEMVVYEKPLGSGISKTFEIYNPTFQYAEPKITIYYPSNGTLRINGNVGEDPDAYQVYIRPYDYVHPNVDRITIDSVLKDSYCGKTNCNDVVDIYGGEFPKLKPGLNTIELGGVNFLKMGLTPRWWTV